MNLQARASLFIDGSEWVRAIRVLVGTVNYGYWFLWGMLACMVYGKY